VIESLQRQFELVQARTTLSHVMQYGDASFDAWRIGVFQGCVRGAWACRQRQRQQ
jgi:hypothetical protein